MARIVGLGFLVVVAWSAVAHAQPSAPDASDSGDVTQLPPLTTDDAGADGSKASKDFIDKSALDAISRGIIWHGYLQGYAAVGMKGAFRKDFVAFADLAQLEFDANVNHVHVVGKPQLIHDALTSSFTFKFRELYAAREYKSFDISVGEHIATWGVTDFWPIVDIVNPRDYSMIRNWQPIDEKLAVPSLRSHLFVGRLTFDAIVVPVTQSGRYVLDQTKPFHLPLAVPDGAEIRLAAPPPATLANVNGGLRVDLAIQAWKVSLYGLVGRDVLPSVHADPGGFVVDNDRVVMTAMSLQGALGRILIKGESAFYRRLHDDCAGVADCFYVRRVPTMRSNLAFETHVMTGLDAHLQLIAQYTQHGDIPVLPPIAASLAPGLPQQYSLERIATLRLQGDYHHGDFRPKAFAVWDYDDQAWFANLDLEYHLADGFAIAPGVFLFDGYAKDPNKNKFTFLGALGSSSNVYLRVTGWF